MKWEPLITDKGARDYIITRINSIANDLAISSEKDPSLIGNNAGISIFWEYLFLISKNNLHHTYCVNLINSSLDAIAETPMSYNFSGGVAGILWAYSHLVNEGSIAINMDNVIGDDIHQFLSDGSKFDIKRCNYDYLHGGLSAIPYFLERSNNEFCWKIIHELITDIEKVADTFPDGISWVEGFHLISEDDRRYNLGMAHGMPSVIVLLSKVLEKNIATEKVNKLLQGLINWVINQKQGDGAGGFYPTVIPSEPPHFSRVSWCYGDLGIAIAILQASIITNNNSWRDEAIKVAINAAVRRQPESGIVDTCICHGTTGNAHIFNRLYNYTGMREFKDAALYWYSETILFYEANKHFKFWTRDEDGTNGRWEDKTGILEGISGIGLTLIAGISDVEPKWDRCFLLS